MTGELERHRHRVCSVPGSCIICKPNYPMPERTYSQEEIAALLERAAELQTDDARRNKNAAGLTLAEIESVASEAGIDPHLVRQAASEMTVTPNSKDLKSKDRSTSHVIVERIVPGTLHEHIWEDIVMELKHRYDSDMGKMMGVPQYGKSTTEKIGRSVEWKHTNMSGYETRLLIRPRANNLHMRLTHRVGWSTALTESMTYGLFITFLTGVVSGAIAHSPLIGIIVAILTMAAVVPLLNWATNSWRDKKQRELDALADHVASLVDTADSIKPSTETKQSANLQARLDAAFLDEDETEEDQTTGQTSRLRERE